tara:strand:- start:1 stop:585 length:585 start_codon:yes stop_codon:yes gene_type:complete
MANEDKLNALINPKILRHAGNGRRYSEVFTLNTNTKGLVCADGWQTEDTTNGVNYPVNSSGFSKMNIWWVSDEASTDLGPRVIVVGKRPFNSASLIAGKDGTIFDTYSAALNWFSCPPLEAPTATLSGAANLYTHAFEFSNASDVDQAEDSIFYSGTTKIYGGPIIDVTGTEQVATQLTQLSIADGYILGQFIE